MTRTNSPRVVQGGWMLAGTGLLLLLLAHWMIFFLAPIEASMGFVQKIFYIHVPAAWTSFLAFGIVALASVAYLWLREERVDALAVSAAEGGLVFGAIMLISGPLWARIAWGAYWEWEPRLTLTLLLWFIFVGYFLARKSIPSRERGRRIGAVISIAGAANIPLIHVSVTWFRSLHPGPVVIKPEGPSLHPDMLAALLVSLAAFTLLFLGILALRYAAEMRRRGRKLQSPGQGAALG